ncbi:tetratricopeptide repeat protein [Desulfonatronum parangueonense]
MQNSLDHADALFRSGKFHEAVDQYIEALKHSPNDARLWANLGNASCE